MVETQTTSKDFSERSSGIDARLRERSRTYSAPSFLEAQRRGRGPPRHVDDADGDGGDDDGDFPFMPDHDEYGQNLPESTEQKTAFAPDSDFLSRLSRKRASIPELLSEKSGGSKFLWLFSP